MFEFADIAEDTIVEGRYSCYRDVVNLRSSPISIISMPIDFKELRELLGALAATDITELSLKSDDFELNVRKDAPKIVAADPAAIQSVAIAPAKPATPTVSLPVSPAVDKKRTEVKSPMVGTFYRAPAPEEPPFVNVGDRIATGQVLCILEAMKLMNEIESEVTGQIVEIAVENGQPVEYGQVLMYVEP
jgi:acetyl-CoA carboxylase biotin carboxyl carrier protein